MEVKFSTADLSNPLATRVLDFFNKGNVSDTFNPFDAAQQFVHQFGNDISEETLENDLENITLQNISIGQTENNSISDDQYQAYNKLSLFIHYIQAIVVDKYTEEYKGLSRMKNPPLEVYDYVGHNKLDIHENKRGYALLYED